MDRSTIKYIYFLNFIYSNENKINKNFCCFFIMVLFRIYLIGKKIFIFLKVIHGYFQWLKIFLKFSKYLI